jgi:hypothetical protein
VVENGNKARNNSLVLEVPQQHTFQLMMGTEVMKSQGLLPGNLSAQSDNIVSDFWSLYRQKKHLAVNGGHAMDSLLVYFSNKQAQHFLLTACSCQLKNGEIYVMQGTSQNPVCTTAQKDGEMLCRSQTMTKLDVWHISFS